MKVIRTLLVLSLSLVVAQPAMAQLGGLLSQGAKRVKQVNDFRWTDEEKAALGAQVSELVRKRYGVVQNAAVHKYVTLVGRTVTEKSTKPGLPWTFIVLDTDAVNAFAAPHGYVHITRGALALMKNEAELAGVLAHEIVHVTDEHTIDALKKNTIKGAAAAEAAGGNALLEYLANAAYNNILDNAYSRGDENTSDTQGIVLIDKAGYAPQGLGSFLTTLAERNKSATEKRGLFSSHPEMQARQDRLTSTITKSKLAASTSWSRRATSRRLHTSRCRNRRLRRSRPARVGWRADRASRPSPPARPRSRPRRRASAWAGSSPAAARRASRRRRSDREGRAVWIPRRTPRAAATLPS